MSERAKRKRREARLRAQGPLLQKKVRKLTLARALRGKVL